jgi:hypothetical protein
LDKNIPDDSLRDQIHSIGTMPHPFEYKMYFNL